LTLNNNQSVNDTKKGSTYFFAYKKGSTYFFAYKYCDKNTYFLIYTGN